MSQDGYVVDGVGMARLGLHEVVQEVRHGGVEVLVLSLGSSGDGLERGPRLAGCLPMLGGPRRTMGFLSRTASRKGICPTEEKLQKRSMVIIVSAACKPRHWTH